MRQNRQVEKVTNLVKVTGPANRLLLPKKALDFCGALPIYNTEVIHVMENGTGSKNFLLSI